MANTILNSVITLVSILILLGVLKVFFSIYRWNRQNKALWNNPKVFYNKMVNYTTPEQDKVYVKMLYDFDCYKYAVEYNGEVHLVNKFNLTSIK